MSSDAPVPPVAEVDPLQTVKSDESEPPKEVKMFHWQLYAGLYAITDGKIYVHIKVPKPVEEKVVPRVEDVTDAPPEPVAAPADDAPKPLSQEYVLLENCTDETLCAFQAEFGESFIIDTKLCLKGFVLTPLSALKVGEKFTTFTKKEPAAGAASGSTEAVAATSDAASQ